MKRVMNIAWALMLALSVTPAWAMGPHGEIENAAELAAVPSYCKGTLVTRYTLPDPKPLQDYIALYGATFNHLHHYCWALNQENHMGSSSGASRSSLYGQILDNFQYVLSKAPDSFTLLPDIYLSEARIMFKFNNNAEAVEALLKLIQLKPAYAQAYAQLGDYYQRRHERDSAIKWYEQGIIQAGQRNAEYFLWKLKKLDGNYTPSAEVAQAIATQKQESADPNTAGDAATLPTASLPDEVPASAIPAANDAKRPNPYCRFCP